MSIFIVIFSFFFTQDFFSLYEEFAKLDSNESDFPQSMQLNMHRSRSVDHVSD